MAGKRIAAFLLVVIVSFGIIAWTSPSIVKNIKLGLDLKGGFEILYSAEPVDKEGIVTKKLLEETAKSLATRINTLTHGVAEPDITPEGSDRIRVRLAGVENEQEVRELLKKPSQLQFRSADGCSSTTDYCKVEMNGNEFVQGGATIGYNSLNQPTVEIKVKEKEKLAEVSQRLLHKQLAIFFDDKLISAPEVQAILDNGGASITGVGTLEEAKDLRDKINLGALPLNLSEIYTQKVGASLGQLSLHETLIAGLVAAVFILLFMLLFYRLPGIVAAITLIMYSWLVLAVLYLMNATLTLPGIAAFVLGVGMAVDANIITYERIKEEIRSGKTILSALRAGSKNSFTAIIDANLTTVIAGGVLFFFGMGSIQGFALILIFSIVVSIATNVYLSRFLLSLLVRANLFQHPRYFGVKPSQIDNIGADGKTELAHKVRMPFDLVKNSKIFFSISIALTLIGVVTLLVFSLNFGVDFKAGTRIDVTADHSIDKNEAVTQIQNAGFDIKGSDVTVGGENNERISIRFDRALNADEEHQITDIFGSDNAEVNKVDPVIAKQLGNRAIMAVLLACVGIMIYVSIRFEWRFALAGIIALIHDAFVVITLFSIFRLEVNLPFIAAVLTIIGYSINDTIVIFDRIRENLRFAKLKTHDQVAALVNRSIWQTMTRSINTVITVLVAAACLLIFGSEAIRLFSLAMIFGLISGVYSSVFIASPLWILFKDKAVAHQKAAAAK